MACEKGTWAGNTNLSPARGTLLQGSLVGKCTKKGFFLRQKKFNKKKKLKKKKKRKEIFLSHLLHSFFDTSSQLPLHVSNLHKIRYCCHLAAACFTRSRSFCLFGKEVSFFS
jgi:hypothetical protein